MALPIPTVSDQRTQQAFNFLRKIFPLGPQHLQNFVLKLAVNADRKVGFGEVKLTFEAGSKKSDEPTVEHGLGVKPVFAALMVEAAGGSETLVVPRVAERTTTKVKFYAASSVAFGEKTEVQCLWLAVG